MTNIALVSRKLATLEDHLQRLRQRRPQTLASLESDLLLQDAIAMGILVVVQEAMDIALHIASDEGWPLAATNREAFAVLVQHRIIAAGGVRGVRGGDCDVPRKIIEERRPGLNGPLGRHGASRSTPPASSSPTTATGR